MYLDLLATLEGSWLGHVGRHSAWLYMATNLLHQARPTVSLKSRRKAA